MIALPSPVLGRACGPTRGPTSATSVAPGLRRGKRCCGRSPPARCRAGSPSRPAHSAAGAQTCPRESGGGRSS
jgi:hypothetical protein